MEARASGPRPSVLSQLAASRYMPSADVAVPVSTSDVNQQAAQLKHMWDMSGDQEERCVESSACDSSQYAVQVFDMTVSDEAVGWGSDDGA